MTEKEQLIQILETEMLPKIYGFCRLKVNTNEEAEDLSQEICLEVLKTIHMGKDIDNFNGFVWSVSNHMFYNLLRKKKYGTTAYLSELISSEENIEEEHILREQKALLRRELAHMSGNYRKAVIMYYYDNLSCEEIGKILGKSSGTVKWWLHDARKAIEKGMDTMREYGERSYNPETLFVSCTGNPGSNLEPVVCAKRKSAQNILMAAYKEPLTIAQLCDELGIAAPYIEDEVEYLVENQLMVEVSKGKYQTDFVILPGDNFGIGRKIYQAVCPEYSDKLISFLEAKKAVLMSEKFNLAGFSWERLLWVYIHMFTDMMTGKYRYDNDIYVKYQDIPLRPNGGKWIALGYGKGLCMEEKIKLEKYHAYDGPVHKVGSTFVQGFFHLWSDKGADSSIFFDTPDEVFVLCQEIIKGNVSIENLTEEQKYYFSIALERNLFVKENDTFRQNYYYVGRDEREELYRMATEFYPEVEGIIKKAYDIVLEEYQKNVPKHLHWQMGNFLSNHLNLLVTCSLFEAEKKGILSEPTENDRYWISLFASEQ